MWSGYELILQRTTKEHYTGLLMIGKHEKTARLAIILWNFFSKYFMYFSVMLNVVVLFCEFLEFYLY